MKMKTRKDAPADLGTCKEEAENKETWLGVGWDAPTCGNVAGNVVTWVDTT